MLLGSQLYSQINQQWVTRYDGLADSMDVATAMAVDNTGNVYVTGYSVGIGTLFDYVTIKYSTGGTPLWTARYNGPANLIDEANAIAIDDSGNVYVTGFSFGLTSMQDYATVKYNANGVQQWVQRYDGPGSSDDEATAIAIDNAGNIIVTGFSRSTSLPGSEDYATIKYTPGGVQQWVSRFNGSGNYTDKATGLITDNSGNIYVTGSSMSSSLPGSEDFATVKYNSSGVQQWAVTYNGPGNSEDIPYAITKDSHNNILVTGSSRNSSVPGSEDYATVKYDPSGNQKWVKRYDGPGNNEDRAFGIATDNQDNVFVTGSSRSTSAPGSEDYATLKYDSSGNQRWVSRYNGPGNNEDKAFGIATDNTGSVYVTGSSRSDSVPGSEDYATVKYDTSGSQQWAARYNGTGNNTDRPYAIVVDNSDNVYVTGSSRSSQAPGSEDYATIKYSPPDAIKIISTTVPSEYNLEQNYPNPFNPSTNIRIDIAYNSFVTLTVYNILGQRVTSLVNSDLQPGKYEVSWDAESLPSGIYFYRLTSQAKNNSSSFIMSKKMLMVK